MTGPLHDLDGRIGEGWGGRPGPNGCHVNVVLGVRGTPTAAALLGTFTTPSPGHTPILVVVGEAQDRYEVVWPPTIMINKATALEDRHQTITWGAGQLGIAQGVLDAVADGLLEPTGDLIVFVCIWIDPVAFEETAVREATRVAVRRAIGMAVEGRDPGPPWIWWRDATRSRARSTGGRRFLRITAIRVERLRLPLDPPFYAAWDPDPRRSFDATIVRVETDSGLVGVGSGDTMNGFDDFVQLFVGRDALAIERHARVLETVSFHAGRYWPLEAALWDLFGQACGQPVASLLGGARSELPAYASWGSLRDPGQRAEDALALVEEGFRAVKIRIAPGRADEGIGVVAAVRDAVGDRIEIMVDLNQWWRMAGDIGPRLDVVGARRIVERLRAYGVLWVEEPLPGEDLRGMRDLRSNTGVRIGGGEMARTFEELRLALDSDALDVYQPDVVLALGISGARTLADLALRRNRWFTPHTWTNGIGVLANLHVCAGVGGGPFLEFPYDPPGWTPARRDFMLASPVLWDGDGLLRVPDAPGLGVCLDEEAVSFYAVDREAVRA